MSADKCNESNIWIILIIIACFFLLWSALVNFNNVFVGDCNLKSTRDIVSLNQTFTILENKYLASES